MKYKKSKLEPTFLGAICSGQDLEHSKRLEEKADACLFLAKFYGLQRKDQLLMASLVTRMQENNEALHDQEVN